MNRLCEKEEVLRPRVVVKAGEWKYTSLTFRPPDTAHENDRAGMVFLWHCEESGWYHLSIGDEIASFTRDQFIAFANMIVNCYLDHQMQGAQSINLLKKILNLYPPKLSNN